MNWLVDGAALNDKPRQGGTHALKGFSFQAGIALVRLTWLLTCRHGVVCLRYDGAQDIDLKFADGKELYIQAKNYGQGNFTLQHLYKSLAGFARDVISAKQAGSTSPSPSFHLMLTSIPTQDSALELIRRKGQDVHAPGVVNEVKPEYSGGQSSQNLLALAKQLLDTTKYFISDIGKPNDTLLSIAGMELMKFGVLPEHIELAMDILLQRLQAGASYYIEDVVEHIQSFFPAAHPAHPQGPMRLLPGKAHLPALATIRKNYFQGQPVIWQAIAHNLDVPRQELAAVQQGVLSHLDIGGMIVVAGPAGSGKSSLIHRVAWNLHHQGSVLAIHVKFPAKVGSDAWRHITRLLQLGKRPILLIVDDVWRHTAFLDEFELHSGPGMILLGSARPAEFPGTPPSCVVCRRNLGKLDASLARQLAAKLGFPAQNAAKNLRGFLDSGQIFALSLHLQQTSLESLAANTFGSLSKGGASLYLDLCLGGMFDLPTPKSLIVVRAEAASVAWPEKSLEGLVFNRDGNDELLQVGHALLASAMVEHAGINPVTRALELCALCAPGQSGNQAFAIRLLKYTTRKFNDLATQCIDRIIRQAEHLAEQAEFADYYQLEGMLKSIGAVDAAAAIIAKTDFGQVRTVRDVSLLISLTDSGNFKAAYPVLLAYYRKKSSLAGFRRFIYLVREHGDAQELDELAELAVERLPLADFPLQETVATLDMLTYGPKPVLKKYAQLVKAYIDQHGLKNRESTLAAVRLAITAKDETIATAVFDGALAEAKSAPLNRDKIVVQQIAKLASVRLRDDVARRKASYGLLLDTMPLTGSEIDHFLIRALAHMSPPEKIEDLLRTLDDWMAVRPSKKKARNLEHTRRLLERRRTEPGSAS